MAVTVHPSALASLIPITPSPPRPITCSYHSIYFGDQHKIEIQCYQVEESQVLPVMKAYPNMFARCRTKLLERIIHRNSSTEDWPRKLKWHRFRDQYGKSFMHHHFGAVSSVCWFSCIFSPESDHATLSLCAVGRSKEAIHETKETVVRCSNETQHYCGYKGLLSKI